MGKGNSLRHNLEDDVFEVHRRPPMKHKKQVKTEVRRPHLEDQFTADEFEDDVELTNAQIQSLLK